MLKYLGCYFFFRIYFCFVILNDFWFVDVCKSDVFCDQVGLFFVQFYVDVVFFLDGFRYVGSVEFEDIRDFLGVLLDYFEIILEFEIFVIGDRVVLLSYVFFNFLFNIQRSFVRIEFNFIIYNSKRFMKRYMEELVR